jgi:drug/metabolite transporter (DMT)-like permease
MVYLLVLISVVAMSAGQLLLKKGLLIIGQTPHSLSELGPFLLKAYSNLYVISAVVLTIITALAWILAVSRAELSHIYPFMALSYVVVAIFSLWLFSENVTAIRWLGIALICVGVFFVARS